MSDIEVNAALVAELRRETGAGMMDCKKALAESGGDKEKALEYLRKKGKAAAEKRADRSTSEGLVAIAQSEDGRTAALVEINCETDFVARNELFRSYAESVAGVVLNWQDADGKTATELAERPLETGVRVGDRLAELTAAIGEKLVLGRFARLHVATGYVGTYLHSDSKLAVLVALEGGTASPDVRTLGRDLAMQVAAAAPTFVRRDEIPPSKIERERALETERARNEGKPEPAIPRIVEGRIQKWFSDVVLLEQPFVKEPKITVRDWIAATAKKTGQDLEVKSFVRVRVGA